MAAYLHPVGLPGFAQWMRVVPEGWGKEKVAEIIGEERRHLATLSRKLRAPQGGGISLENKEAREFLLLSAGGIVDPRRKGGRHG